MKNKIQDLRDHLFMALEALNNPELQGERLEEEVRRAKAISEVSQVLVNTARVEINFINAVDNCSQTNIKGTGFIQLPEKAE